MANHKSSIKRIRSNDAKRVLNKYQNVIQKNKAANLKSGLQVFINKM